MENLKGNTQLNKHRKIAEHLVAAASKFKSVVGILYTGSLVRGFADRYSDIDVIVVVRKKNDRLARILWNEALNEQRREVVHMDFLVFSLIELKRRRWTELDRYDYGLTQIVYDPKGLVADLLREKLHVPRDFWTRRIVVNAIYLQWYCCAFSEEEPSLAEVWVKRGDLISAHYCVNYSLEVFVKLLFAMNHEFLPPPKWRLYYSYKLKLPKDYVKGMSGAMLLNDFSEPELKRRLASLRRLWPDVLGELERQRMNLKSIEKYYVTRVLRINNADFTSQ